MSEVNQGRRNIPIEKKAGPFTISEASSQTHLKALMDQVKAGRLSSAKDVSDEALLEVFVLVMLSGNGPARMRAAERIADMKAEVLRLEMDQEAEQEIEEA